MSLDNTSKDIIDENECGWCGGSGSKWHSDDTGPLLVSCPSCRGTGKKEIPKGSIQWLTESLKRLQDSVKSVEDIDRGFDRISSGIHLKAIVMVDVDRDLVIDDSLVLSFRENRNIVILQARNKVKEG